MTDTTPQRRATTTASTTGESTPALPSGSPASATPRPALNLTYVRIELLRLLRDIPTLVFTAILPSFFFVIFGAAPSYGADTVGKGNVTMVVMVTMAAYGAVTATTSIGGMAAIERLQGWGRQLGLTPMTDRGYVAVKVVVALTISIIPVGIVFVIGGLTGASAPLSSWLGSAAMIVVGAVMFALYGLCFGLALKSEAALAAAGGSLVVLSFLGNLFIPLSGSMLKFARFTPLYGLNALVRYPVTDGWAYTGDSGQLVRESIWIAIANVVIWTVIFATIANLLVRRSRQRG